FDWIFAPGRSAAIKQCALAPGDTVLEVGIGTGLNLPLYPAACRLTGIDLSGEMLDKAVERVQNLAMPNVTLKVMDATSMDFGDNEFDKAVASYTISAVPDPVAVLREMRRVVKPGGSLVLSAAFLVEFLSDGALPALDALTPAPVRESLGPSADRWTGASLGVAPPLVLVHGYAPMGKDDPRLARAAALLARTGFDVT